LKFEWCQKNSENPVSKKSVVPRLGTLRSHMSIVALFASPFNAGTRVVSLRPSRIRRSLNNGIDQKVYSPWTAHKSFEFIRLPRKQHPIIDCLIWSLSNETYYKIRSRQMDGWSELQRLPSIRRWNTVNLIIADTAEFSQRNFDFSGLFLKYAFFRPRRSKNEPFRISWVCPKFQLFKIKRLKKFSLVEEVFTLSPESLGITRPDSTF
jgi:hypothetical protein